MSTPTPAPSPPLRNSYWVIPGKVLAGEHPTAATVEATRERLQRLMDAGVECFIDLTEPGEIKPYDAEIPFSIEYLRKPIKDHGIPSQRAHMAEILDCIHDALQSGRCVYVHCRAGIGRTGTVIGCLLVERGLEGEGAIDELNRLWQQCERSQNWPSVPETDDQVGYVKKWKPRAVFAEELSLASAAARQALGGKSGLPSTPTSGAGSTAGANAVLGRGQAPGVAGSGVVAPGGGSRAAPGAGLPAGRSGSGPDAPAAKSGGGASAEPALSRLGLPLLDDDDDGPSDFATFNRAQGIPSSTASGRGGTTPGGGPAPATNPGDWPSFGKQPAGSARPAASAGQGTQSNKAAPNRGSFASTRETSKAGASTRGSAPGNATASDPAKHGIAARDSAGDTAPADIATRGAPNAGAAARDSATADATARGPAARGSIGDPAAADIAATRGAPNAGATTRDASTADATARGLATRISVGDPAAADIAARAPNVLTSNTTPDDDPLADPGALSAARSLRDRFLGALLGLAVGDAVSAATQFRKPGTFTPVGDMIGGGPFDLPRGGWSDDTAMALCLADSLLERDGFDARDQMERYRKWQQEGYLTATGQSVGITASTARAIAMSAWRRGALFGSHDPAQLDPEPLSRVAPAVMFFFAASGQAVEQATEAARTTCQAPAVLDACRSLARALHAALAGQPKAIVLEKAVQAIGNAPGRTATGISASAALTAAVAAFGATANFRDAVLYAANLGGDSDVISAVCGQLAGAYYSVKAIPTSWHNGLIQKDLIISYADRLLTHAMLGLSG